MNDPNCSLCNLQDKENDEKIYYQDDEIIIVDTKDKKRHRCRIMVVVKDHVINVSDDLLLYALHKLIQVGKEVFSYTPKFVIMEATFATIKAHWHLVATDLNPDSDDFNQILKTPWVDIVGTSLEGIM